MAVVSPRIGLCINNYQCKSRISLLTHFKETKILFTRRWENFKSEKKNSECYLKLITCRLKFTLIETEFERDPNKIKTKCVLSSYLIQIPVVSI